MEEQIRQLINKYNIRHLELDKLIFEHENNACFCDTCHSAHSKRDMAIEIYNDLVRIINNNIAN